ncbi:unnamed protein product [Amaranthus hypochondriacus]
MKLLLLHRACFSIYFGFRSSSCINLHKITQIPDSCFGFRGLLHRLFVRFASSCISWSAQNHSSSLLHCNRACFIVIDTGGHHGDDTFVKFVGWSSVHGLLTENLILEAVLIMEEMIAQLMEDTASL